MAARIRVMTTDEIDEIEISGVLLPREYVILDVDSERTRTYEIRSLDDAANLARCFSDNGREVSVGQAPHTLNFAENYDEIGVDRIGLFAEDGGSR